jgi:hypothetical protein
MFVRVLEERGLFARLQPTLPDRLGPMLQLDHRHALPLEWSFGHIPFGDRPREDVAKARE